MDRTEFVPAFAGERGPGVRSCLGSHQTQKQSDLVALYCDSHDETGE
jgi:hypothetical protein